jgi:hypothetical protein
VLVEKNYHLNGGCLDIEDSAQAKVDSVLEREDSVQTRECAQAKEEGAQAREKCMLEREEHVLAKAECMLMKKSMQASRLRANLKGMPVGADLTRTQGEGRSSGRRDRLGT